MLMVLCQIRDLLARYSRAEILIILFLGDMTLTLFSRMALGDWGFEANPLIPDHLLMFGIVTILYMWAAMKNQFFYWFHVGVRGGAIISHPYLWIRLAFGGAMPEQPEMALWPTFLLGAALPVVVLIVPWYIKRRF